MRGTAMCTQVGRGDVVLWVPAVVANNSQSQKAAALAAAAALSKRLAGMAGATASIQDPDRCRCLHLPHAPPAPLRLVQQESCCLLRLRIVCHDCRHPQHHVTPADLCAGDTVAGAPCRDRPRSRSPPPAGNHKRGPRPYSPPRKRPSGRARSLTPRSRGARLQRSDNREREAMRAREAATLPRRRCPTIWELA